MCEIEKRYNCPRVLVRRWGVIKFESIIYKNRMYNFKTYIKDDLYIGYINLKGTRSYIRTESSSGSSEVLSELFSQLNVLKTKLSHEVWLKLSTCYSNVRLWFIRDIS